VFEISDDNEESTDREADYIPTLTTVQSQIIQQVDWSSLRNGACKHVSDWLNSML
jgi:hypothetical protein